MKHELPALPYSYDALEPHIDARTMEIHYTKHHQGYVDKLNAALAGRAELADKPLEELLGDLDSAPNEIRIAVRNNGGGHFNHSLFWKIMSPRGGGEPTDKMAEKIKKAFGDYGKFKEVFAKEALGIFGSGWVWLAENGSGELKILSTPNQDTPLALGLKPIAGLDVWEHAYYLKHQNRRADYVAAWWNVLDWVEIDKITERGLYLDC